MTLPQTETMTALAEQKGERLDVFIAARVEGLSRSRVKALILAGEVVRTGPAAPAPLTDPGYRIAGDETIAITIPPAEPAVPEAEDIPLTIVYEDDQVIVIDKPKGLVVHPAAGNWTGTLVNALIAHCGETLSGIGGVRRPGIVHRLDKDTTGLMVVAKTDQAHQSLSAQFADHGRSGPLTRGYLAFVWGSTDRPRGTISAPLERHPHQREKMAVREGGREAITHWDLRERYAANDDTSRTRPAPIRTKSAHAVKRVGLDASRSTPASVALPFTGAGNLARAYPPGSDNKPALASLIACRLETGRTHQIRVHMAHAGHPLLGDDTYGPGFKTKISRLPPEAAEALTALKRQALHAYLLGFEHPVSGEHLEFESELPADLARLRDALRGA